MKTAKDIMAPAVISVSPETPFHEAIELLVENRVSGLPVVDDSDRLVGIISEADRLRLISNPEQLKNRPVSEFMTCGVITVDEQASLNQIADLLMRVGIRRLPVVNNGRVVGIVSRGDLVRALHEGPDPVAAV